MSIIQTYLDDSGLWFLYTLIILVINENHIGNWMLLKPGYTLAFAFLENSLILFWSLIKVENSYKLSFYKSTRSKARIAIFLFFPLQWQSSLAILSVLWLFFNTIPNSYHFSIMYHVSLFYSPQSLFKSHLCWIC